MEAERESLTTEAGRGEAIWFAGALVEVKAPTEWSDGAFSLVEVTARRGRATPLHADSTDETFYVVDGELAFHVAGREERAGTGHLVAVPRGVPHAFLVLSETARFLVLNTPGGHDRYFRDGGEPATARGLGSAPPPDGERIERASEEHGVALLGPPPFAGLHEGDARHAGADARA